ncbi:hypothetical protein [Streptococcus oricebi]|uniref:Uncharacterized protein n=1 Tax=Streptococcus oricebi TaxID=1547447 RepID=A0ABS5B1Z9_9STRE|nr:hypothetical protein [Streptococcus oricebi]MBP2622790.1 hypothetical protein [Streptococcus oricebi]
MDTLFDYRYRKKNFISRLFLATFILAFTIVWSLAASQFFPVFGASDSHFSFSLGKMLFVFVPSCFFILSLYMLITALIRLLPLSIIKGNQEGLMVRPGYFKSYFLSWSEIESLRYESGTYTTYDSDYGRRDSRYDYLYIKPVDKRTLRVTISDLNGTIDDLVSDFKKINPNLTIKGI